MKYAALKIRLARFAQVAQVALENGCGGRNALNRKARGTRKLTPRTGRAKRVLTRYTRNPPWGSALHPSYCGGVERVKPGPVASFG